MRGDFQEFIEEIVKLFVVGEAFYHVVEEFDTGCLVHVASIQNAASAKMSDVKVLEAIESELLFRQIKSSMKIARVRLHGVVVAIVILNMFNKDVRVSECGTRIVEMFVGDDFLNDVVHHSGV